MSEGALLFLTLCPPLPTWCVLWETGTDCIRRHVALWHPVDFSQWGSTNRRSEWSGRLRFRGFVFSWWVYVSWLYPTITNQKSHQLALTSPLSLSSYSFRPEVIKSPTVPITVTIPFLVTFPKPSPHLCKQSSQLAWGFHLFSAEVLTDAEAVEVDYGSKAGERGLEVDMVGRGHFLYIFWGYNQLDDKLNVISEGKRGERLPCWLSSSVWVVGPLKERKSNGEEGVGSWWGGEWKVGFTSWKCYIGILRFFLFCLSSESESLKEMENGGRRPGSWGWTLGHDVKVNICFKPSMEFRGEVFSVDINLVIVSIQMVFKAKRLDKILYEECMCLAPKTCKFLINTSTFLVHCHLNKLFCTLYSLGISELWTSINWVTKCQIISVFLYLCFLSWNNYKQPFFLLTCYLRSQIL